MSWRSLASCRPGTAARPQDFSPVDTRGRVRLDDAQRVARTFCQTCPVLEVCLAEAVQLRESGWGPQELVMAGIWWPIDTATDPRPINLLPLLSAETAA